VKNFLSLKSYSAEELYALFDRASELKRLWNEKQMPQSLLGQRIGLWFYGNGFRNRLAFELGARAMGACVAYIPGELGVHEPTEDIAGYLQNWFTMLILRTKRHEDLFEVASKSHIPVINARTDQSHPCEIMGDLSYLRQTRCEIKGLNVVFVGEPSNLCMSWLEAAKVFPIRVTQVCPPGYEVSRALLRDLHNDAAGQILVTNDLRAALVDVDVIYTDCWPKAQTSDEKNQIKSAFAPYQILPVHLASLNEGGAFLPCPPVTRGEEVSSDAMASTLCKNHAAKDNLLHVQNAIMELLAGNP
jgi:ornithine carbamoyltransferase